MQYQVLYHGCEEDPNKVVSVPCSFDDANRLAHELQWESVCDPAPDKKKDIYVVEPIFEAANT